ncbi:MAG: hypothetical protein HOL85_17440 [Rhodospirillaceae bacterium]|jgi:hypothetical protein|nr:hypothetical protein [Rhodospirillaceae bacterium]MBT6138429.1 hypothetical protein [Rhodospirillaceae bacterium]
MEEIKMNPIVLAAKVVVICVCLMTFTPAFAEPSDGEKLQLKSAVTQHITSHTDSGTYLFVRNDNTELLKLTYVAMHPVVFSHPNGLFVLCADFNDAGNKKVLVDYYVRKIGETFVVLSSIEGKRSLLMRLAEKFNL